MIHLLLVQQVDKAHTGRVLSHTKQSNIFHHFNHALVLKLPKQETGRLFQRL